MEEENNHGCLGIIISIIVLAVVIGVLSNWGKYDGESAEFWFNAYDQSEADNGGIANKIRYFNSR